MKFRRKTIFLLGGIVCLMAAGAAVAWIREIPYQQWESKDGTLEIIVKKRWLYCFFSMMPGQGGDAPGTVTVRNKSTGKTVMRKKLEMVSMAKDELGEFRER